jgi:uncharacterized membrane protein YphA (DoxX/SURF4 family)
MKYSDIMTRSVLPPEPLTWMKSNQDKVGILIMRYLFAMVWLSQGLIKVIERNHEDMYADYNGFLGDLNYMAATNPNSVVVDILQDFMIPNYEIILILVVLTELSIGTSLLLGLFTRLGSIIGGVMTITLWILTLGWDEWLWTYPLIFFPHVLFFLSRSGQYLGIDKALIGDGNQKKILRVLT